MKKLVVLPSDAIQAYIDVGFTYEYLENYFNPGNYFDEVYCLSMFGDNNYSQKGKIRYLKCTPKMMHEKIKEIKPDVVRAYGAYISSDLAQIAKVKGIPIIVSVHDTNPTLIHSSLKYADYIICMAEAVKKAVLKKIKFDESKIWIMPNRIDETIMQKKYDKNIFFELNSRFPGNKHIIHVGRKDKQKNIDTVIRSLSYLDKDVVAIFIGRGDVLPYEELAKQLGVEKRCFFVESVKNDELSFWYSWCDCFCTPSRWEGFGYVFIEAAACEAPIITSNIGPMNEYLTNGVNSILVDDYENPKIIADAIKEVLSGSEKIKKMCKAARLVGLNFAKNIVDDKEIDIYKYVMSQKINSKKAPWLLRKRWERNC